MNKRELHIPIELSNLLKLLACIAILLHHYSQYGLDSHKVSGPFFEILRSVGGDLSVTIFFFLSGYGLMVSEIQRKFEIKRFVLKRFWRILQPFWAVNLVAVIIYWILDADNIAVQSPLHAIGSILGIVRYDPTMWFIHYLLILYILFAIGMLARRPILFVGASVIAFIIIAIINRLPSHLWSSLFAFPMGMIVGSKPEPLLRFFRRYDVIIIGLSIYALVLYAFVFRTTQINGPLWHQMNNLLLILFLLFFTGRINRRYFEWYRPKAKWQPYYEVYLVHPKILFISIFCFDVFLPIWILIPMTAGIALIFCTVPSILGLKPSDMVKKICFRN